MLELVLCERGNNLFVNEEGDLVFFAEIGKNNWLQVSYHAQNYPAFNINTVQSTTQDIVKHINDNLQGWYARKCNIEGVNLDDGCVAYSDD